MLKIHKFLVSLFSIMAILISLSPPTWSQERIADANEIVSVHFFIYKSLGSINSYVIFVDKNGRECATTGRLIISKKYVGYSKKSKFIGYAHIDERNAPEVKTEHLKNISFEPSDFQYMTLVNKQEIYALPIELPPNKIDEGDIVILEWRSFKIEKKLYGSP